MALGLLINLPIGLLAIAGALFAVEESKDAGHADRIDLVGMLLAAIGFAAVVFGLIEGQRYGWWAPRNPFAVGSLAWPLAGLAITPVMFLLGVLSLAAFVLYELRLEARGGEPLFAFSLLQYRGFRYGLLTALIVSLGEFGVLFVLPIYLQVARGLSAFSASLVLLPFALAMLLVAPTAGMLAARIGAKWVVTGGMVCETIALFWLSRMLAVDMSFLSLVPMLLLYGAGTGLATAQLANITLSDIPREQVGAGSGANNTMRQVGSAIGVAILGAVLAAQIASVGNAELRASAAVPAQAKPAVAQVLSNGLSGEAPQGAAGAADSPVGRAVQRIIADAITEGTRAAAVAAALFVVFGALELAVDPSAGPAPAGGPQDRDQAHRRGRAGLPTPGAETRERAGHELGRGRAMSTARSSSRAGDQVALFDYDPVQPLDVQETGVEVREGIAVHDVSYAGLVGGQAGGRVEAFLVTPPGAGAFPAVLFVHRRWLHPAPGDRRTYLDEAIELAGRGVAGLLIDAPWSRGAAWGRTMGEPEHDLQAYLDTAKDLRRGLDLLALRPEVDAGRLACAGHSLGALMAGILAGVDRRLKTCVLMAGAGSFADVAALNLPQLRGPALDHYRQVLAPLAPQTYVGQAAPTPLLFQFGLQDHAFPREQFVAFAAAGSEPKVVKWYCADHSLAEPAAWRDRVAWLCAQLGVG